MQALYRVNIMFIIAYLDNQILILLAIAIVLQLIRTVTVKWHSVATVKYSVEIATIGWVAS